MINTENKYNYFDRFILMISASGEKMRIVAAHIHQMMFFIPNAMNELFAALGDGG